MSNPRGLWAVALSTLMLLSTLTLLSTAASAQPLVDCSKPEYQKTSSARSLFLWSSGAVARVKEMRAKGTFHNQRRSAKETDGAFYCRKQLSNRGSAHCKEPQNAEYRKGLAELLQACKEASQRPKVSGAALVDCTNKRFTHKQASIAQLLSWVDLGLSGLRGLRSHERTPAMIKAKCDSALNSAGAAYCKASGRADTRAAVAKVRKACADFRAAVAAGKAKAAKAERDRVAAAKAKRKIVAFPRSTYRGKGAAGLARAMRRALRQNGLAKSAKDVLRVQPMGRWKRGRYTDTRVPYQKITGLVLWHDKDADGVCRFVSYNFAKKRRGGGWSPLKVQSFCLGCLEGWTRCK